MHPSAQAFLNTIDSTWSFERVVAEVASLSIETHRTEEELLNELAAEVAKSFASGKLNHSISMERASILYGAQAPEKPLPSLLYEVYWALDEGEYGAEPDGGEGIDPENRSLEQVRSILRRVETRDA